jgi:phosphoglycolate phosphatase-like HAD superfamily hydrolase
VTARAIPPEIYGADGPFVTVYLDATRATESGAHEVELRWRELRGQLIEQGADDADLVALDGAVDDDRGVAGRHGLVLVAAGGKVVFGARLARPPARPDARVAPLPHLVPFLAQQSRHVPHVLVVADRTGADIAVELSADQVEHESVEGTHEYPLHRTSTADWSEWHFQTRVENAWQANARDVAAEVTRRAKQTGAKLVVLAGDERARTLIREALSGSLNPATTITDVSAGGRGEGSSESALAAAARDAVLHEIWRERRELLEHLQQNLGRGEYAVAGVSAVVDALRKAQADTVVLSDDPSSTLVAYVGPNATDFGMDEDELNAMGVAQPQRDRFDAALLRAVTGTGARLVVTPNAHDYLPEGIGALLRYETA